MRDASDVVPDELRQLLRAEDVTGREAAWSGLVARYNALLLHVARTVAVDREDAMDAYALVLEELRAEDFRRLRSYAGDGRSKFTTWLVVVVQRICLDFVRRRYGRRRETVRQDVRVGRKRLSRRQLHELLSAPADLTLVIDENGPPPDIPLREQELQRHLATALSELRVEDRLLLKLRFEDGLTAREIATLLGWPTQFHVYRQLNALTGDLRHRLAARGIESSSP